MKKLLIAMFLVLVMAVPVLADPPPINTATSQVIAAPFEMNGGVAWGNAIGGWWTQSGGAIEVTSYAQGTKSADTMAYAQGTAFGKGFALGIETPWFGFGVSGALSAVTLEGGGLGLGIDKFSFGRPPFTPDYASVGVCYIGGAEQGNGILVDNGAGTFAGGKNTTGTIFWGGSFNESHGKFFGIDNLGPLVPAFAVGFDGGGGLAGGFSIAGYIDTPNFAMAGAKTVGFSGYCADDGIVWGKGGAIQQAVINPQGNFGLSAGQATFGYAGNGSLGYGIAETSGWTKYTSGCGSSTIKSFSSSSSSSTVK